MVAHKVQWSIVLAVLVVVSMSLSTFMGGIASPTQRDSGTPLKAQVPVPTPTAANTPAPAITPATSGAGPHPGTLDVYEVAPAGANSEDPAIAYDTVSFEPILNVYETLVNYNNSSTATFVPTLATCVPGPGQCVTDYGSNLTGYVNGQPIYWTFVIDPAAHFYDPGTGKSWQVYPSDVMFSIARTIAWADQPYVGKSPGWILAQSLLPFGASSYDSALHFPYNNTPYYILSSMLVNDSKYCPAKAMDGVHGNGCLTFVANGGGTDWPFFLELVADNLGGSVVPCGWFTAQGAGIPGWNGTKAAHGDGPCLLPNGGNATDLVSWGNYLNGLKSAPASWDSFEKLNDLWPATQPNVQWNMTGSGPYAASITVGTGYELEANPAYEEPSGCSGANGLAVYKAPYCDPAPGAYVNRVNVFWEPNDAFGISQYNAGQADFAGIQTTHTTTLLSLAAAHKLDYTLFPTLSDFFTPINLAWNTGVYSLDFPSQPVPNVPSNFFSNLALREFYVHSYPYLTVENTIRTVDGIQYTFNAGGPIPYGMGDYYPNNVTYPGGDPYHPSTDPDTNPTDVGGAAWWWAQLTNPSSQYYDSQAAGCSKSSPCTWPIAGLAGDPGDDIGIADWISDIESLTGDALQPFGGATFDLTFPQFLDYAFASPYASPLVSETGTGWAPDYPDPTDYMTPMALPDSTYTAPDTFSQQVALPAYNNTAGCGHADPTSFQDLSYWVNESQTSALATSALTTSCQGVAYDVAVGFAQSTASLPVGPQRTLYYNMVEQILNALAMYIWNGQSNELVSWAPWINGQTINENPVIGGGGDQLWFHIKYQTASYDVNYTETGLATGTTWTVTLGTTTLSSTTSGSSDMISFPHQVNGTFAYSLAYVKGYNVTPSNDTVTITGKNQSVAIVFTPVGATTKLTTLFFNETGLVSNTTWGVLIGGVGTVSSNVPSLNFSLPVSSTYNATPFVVPGYTVTPTLQKVVLTDVPATVAVTYTDTILQVYPVTFSATGLPSGQSWTVNLSGPKLAPFALTSNTSTITFYETNGTYAASYKPPTGLVAPGPTSSVLVAGPTTVLVPLTASANAFALKFTQTGLGGGLTWSVNIGNFTVTSTGASLAFELSNGNYNWSVPAISGWVVTPPNGTAKVSGSSTAAVALVFKQYTYTVTFAESGLPSGTSWYVTVPTEQINTTSTSVTLAIQLPNGTFQYTVSQPAGYEALPAAIGNVTVAANATTVSIVYVLVFAVTFTESGLPSGQSWTVFFASQTRSGASPTITFEVANGTWSFGIGPPSGYYASTSGGAVAVNGAGSTVPIHFSSTTPSATYLGNFAYELIGAMAALAVIGFVLAAHFARRRPPQSPPPKGWTEKAETPPAEAKDETPGSGKGDSSGPTT